MKAFVRPRAWSLLATIIFLFLAPLIFSITVRLNPFLLFYNQLDEFAKLSIQADNVHPEIVNMFMICDNFDGNPYPGVYMGWLEKLIANEDNKVRLILLEFSSANFSHIIELLPMKSIIVTIYHNDNYFNLKELVEYRKFYGLPQVGLVVLNHEQPWISAFALTKDDYPYRNRFLNHLYGHFKIVLRNYYFLALKQSALFFPLGPMYHNSPLTTEHQDFFAKGMILRSSLRPIRCSFRGRLVYTTNSVHHQNRFDLFRLGLEMNESFPCLMEQSEQRKEDNYTNTFVNFMTDSVFVLCPFGNSPETFRHYEAFEYGAIPLLVRPQEKYDFISEIWGTDYPGPVFENWQQAISYAALSHNTSELDRLQSDLLEWYMIFKERCRLNIQALIVDAFSDSNIFDDSKNAPHFAAIGFKYKTNVDANISVIFDSNVNGEANH